ncbi:hypothetical protein [Sinosporangium siamense]|uniref:Uncharacterized protein n=1 Tax=Sinosporangium siamense TaxID=1367973 RepID=A0A919V7D0_9ACTN|nr:hypothetical protein [Sinosporangium siamense]GII93333.1 hypothetical protein Ssi02_35640 [Sinosporangium siamense]
MKRYLLFDDGCHVCASTAKGVEEDSGYWLVARSLRDPHMKTLLDTHKPGWKHRPTLVEDDGTHIRVSTGLAMSARLTAGVGLRRTARIARRVARRFARETSAPAAEGRRDALRAAGVGALALLGLTFGVTPAGARAPGDPDLLQGAALKRALDAAQRDAQVKTAVGELSAAGFDGAVKQALAFTGDTGSTVVVLFFAPLNKAEAKNRAAVLSHQYGGTLEQAKTLVEYVSADLDTIKKKDSFSSEDFHVTRGAAAPAGAGEYFGCMLTCVGGQCTIPAMRCRALIFLWAVLACMVAVCGSKARSCHGICKTLW